MESPIKTYRLENQLTQKALAEKLGVSLQLISHIETGRKRITPENANDWSKIIGVPREILCPLFMEQAA